MSPLRWHTEHHLPPCNILCWRMCFCLWMGPSLLSEIFFLWSLKSWNSPYIISRIKIPMHWWHQQKYISAMGILNMEKHGLESKEVSVKDESLGLVSVSRLKVPRLSVSSWSRTKFWNLSRLGLVLDENFLDSLIPVSSRWFHFYLVSSWSRPDLDE